jgi:MFS family permease
MPLEPSEDAVKVPDSCCGGLNRNVRLILIYVTMLSMYSSLVSQTPLAAYILLLREDSGIPHDYTAVGVASGLQGVVSLIIAFPAAALADQFGRQTLLRCAAIMALLTAAYTAWCLLYTYSFTAEARTLSSGTLYYLLLGSSALWGVFMGLHSAPLEALFGDSVPSGQRSKLYVWRSSLRTLGNVLGPLISIVVFLHEDAWEEYQLTIVMLVGLGCSVAPAIVLCLFSDKHALGDASEGFKQRRRSGRTPTAAMAGGQRVAAENTLGVRDSSRPLLSTPEGNDSGGGGGRSSVSVVGGSSGPPSEMVSNATDGQTEGGSVTAADGDSDDGDESGFVCRCPRSVQSIAPLVAMADTMQFLGSGMTVNCARRGSGPGAFPPHLALSCVRLRMRNATCLHLYAPLRPALFCRIHVHARRCASLVCSSGRSSGCTLSQPTPSTPAGQLASPSLQYACSGSLDILAAC